MNAWNKYSARIESIGATKRDTLYQREVRTITNKIKDSLSYFTVTIDGTEQDLTIVSSKNMNEKTIISLPGEKITSGGLVYWMDNYWLITEKDADYNVYEKATMTQCNHILRWIDADGVLHEQWCIISDGTKYMTGELEDRQFVVTRPDSRIVLTIARNEDTIKFSRLNRFLIDDPDSPLKLSYQLTKPVKLGNVYNNEGVFKFVLQEVNSTADDNHQLGIADYYKYYPKVIDDEAEDPDSSPSDEPQKDTEVGEKKGWL